MTPTREQLIEDIAGKLWRDLCEGEGQHSEALDKSLIRKHMDRLAACLAALLPPADPPHDCEAWRLEGLGCARCNKADPPALVALVREEWRKAVYPHHDAATFSQCLADTTAPGWDDVRVEVAAVERIAFMLVAYPLPAAPPAPEPQAMPPIEVGDVARLDGFGLVTVNRPEEAGVLSLGSDGLVAVYKPVWTREPRR